MMPTPQWRENNEQSAIYDEQRGNDRLDYTVDYIVTMTAENRKCNFVYQLQPTLKHAERHHAQTWAVLTVDTHE